MISKSIQKEEIIVLNIYVSNAGSLNYVKPTLLDLKGQEL
jgi:hypothetical protein